MTDSLDKFQICMKESHIEKFELKRLNPAHSNNLITASVRHLLPKYDGIYITGTLTEAGGGRNKNENAGISGEDRLVSELGWRLS
ncbi:hypothetical protein Pcinc_027572 [Petrolisthes cinctipes]|uniref:Uncharacterized protein n=1 Tax=Petrolisthes cinctipes TaxID=88211 RepID=A0AAE1F3U6_PETCI|nr:hypothetical protein Pcinc_027572 [Petrolisthes cinctipes]